MPIKPKVKDKLWVVRIELADGIVQLHPITKELDFVDNNANKHGANIYHYTKNEAIDGIINHLLSLKDSNIKRIITAR